MIAPMQAPAAMCSGTLPPPKLKIPKITPTIAMMIAPTAAPLANPRIPLE